MSDDPCYRCTLPDCDEHDPRCLVRQLNRRYWCKVRSDRHGEITDEERDANNRVFNFWKLDRMAEASEGGRPFRRGGKVYGQPSGANT